MGITDRQNLAKDVMIDFLGFVVSTVIIYTVSAVLRIIIQKANKSSHY